jgi:acid phosphatase (class A)
MKLKKHFNRPRPKVLAKKMNIKMKDIEMASMKTPSYPSGHSTQGMLIGLVLSKKYPRSRKGFMQTAMNISDSRNVAHAHYKSDSEFGKKLGKLMYNHIKNKI